MRLKDFQEFSDPVMVYTMVKNLLDIDRIDPSVLDLVDGYVCGVRDATVEVLDKKQSKLNLTVVRSGKGEYEKPGKTL